MTLLTVVTAVISAVAFTRVGRTLGDITDRSMPAVNRANVAAAAPGLVSSGSEDGRNAIKAQIGASLGAIESETR